jgi:hypothetical protein
MNGMARLRDFAARGRTQDRCALCAAPVEGRHGHVVEAATGGVLCVCRGCAGVFDHASGRFRRIPDRVVALDALRMSDEDWSAFAIPVGLAFFRRNSAQSKVQAFYPSPLGAVETSVPEPAWESLVGAHPELASMEPDVEAFLVRVSNRRRECFIAPLDECHALIGLIRREWRGFTGGDGVAPALDRFFAELREKSGGRR